MAYAAVISLKQTIYRILNSSYISTESSVRETVKLAYDEVFYLQLVLERGDEHRSSRNRERLYGLDGEIREAVCELEDVIESHVSDLLLSHREESFGDSLLFSVDLQEDVDSFIRKVKKMKKDYFIEVRKFGLRKEEDCAHVSSTIDFGGELPKMVGLSGYDDDDITSRIQIDGGRKQITIVDLLDTGLDRLEVVSFFGMAGMGKTTLAIKVYQNTSIMPHFKHRAWVNIGQEYQSKEIMRHILRQLDPGNSEVLLEKSEAELRDRLNRSLYNVRYLVVLDDVWDEQLWDELRSCFPDNSNGSRVLLTTRQMELAAKASGREKIFYEMRFLNEEESWFFLCEKLFLNQSNCPRQLVEAGKKIAKKCDGLPLTIETVGDILSKAEKSPEYWNRVAEEKKNSVFIDAYDRMSEVLLSSYHYLPQYLQTCFLYMGVFPQDYEIARSMLTKLWSAEGFLEPNLLFQSVERLASGCLRDLVLCSLVILLEPSSNQLCKTCRLHSTYRYLCNKEAGKNNTFHALDIHEDISIPGIKNHRRLSVQNNILFNIKDVYSSMTSILSLRSMLCVDPNHQYPIQICSKWRLLRVLDALAIRFYQFPVEVLKLVLLRYLSITYHGKLPAIIVNLRNLQSLIVHQHVDIRFSEDPWYLPVEIWEMKELKHLNVTGSCNLPDPPCGVVLPNLVALLDVSAQSCTKRVFESVPNLKKLRVRIELTPDSAIVPLSFFDHISHHLHVLESLTYVVVNPKPMLEVVSPPISHPIILPSTLKKLKLSGFGFPWKHMNKMLSSLSKLEVLKLRSYDFCGLVWEMQEEDICPQLKVLRLEDVDLVEWKCECSNFPRLQRLSIRHGYKLKGIPSDIGFINSLYQINLVDCSTNAVRSAEVIREEQDRLCNPTLNVDVEYSYDR